MRNLPRYRGEPADHVSDRRADDLVLLRRVRVKLTVLTVLTAVVLFTRLSPWLSAGLLALTVLLPIAVVGDGGLPALRALLPQARSVAGRRTAARTDHPARPASPVATTSGPAGTAHQDGNTEKTWKALRGVGARGQHPLAKG
ncbi:hypothetical protein E1091_16995 [Micromonospora fluostatini]|uniref:Uncharacterized protein n=1 Tax=Micromonospora fluostatini TaxID=1629071 RepID=A0ABY2DD63_9ACTN|nr:hypothetical protein E1091_16995 [Micromonospora fluostatini]